MAPLSRFASKNPYAALFESSPAEGSGRIAATVPHPRLQFPEVMPSTAESGLRRAKVLCKDMEDLSIQLEYQLFEVQNADEDASEEDLDGEGETTDGMKEEKSKKEVQSVEAKELTGNVPLCSGKPTEQTMPTANALSSIEKYSGQPAVGQNLPTVQSNNHIAESGLPGGHAYQLAGNEKKTRNARKKARQKAKRKMLRTGIAPSKKDAAKSSSATPLTGISSPIATAPTTNELPPPTPVAVAPPPAAETDATASSTVQGKGSKPIADEQATPALVTRACDHPDGPRVPKTTVDWAIQMCAHKERLDRVLLYIAHTQLQNYTVMKERLLLVDITFDALVTACGQGDGGVGNNGAETAHQRRVKGLLEAAKLQLRQLCDMVQQDIETRRQAQEETEATQGVEGLLKKLGKENEEERIRKWLEGI